LGDIVYVELPEVGSAVEAKGSFGVVESVKAASDVYSPVSGEVIEINENLADTPGMVNESAFADGWLMKVKMSNPSEVDSMMDAAAYEASWCARLDSTRLDSTRRRLSVSLAYDDA
jgi:glycine cleavage system H protein